MKNFFTKHKTLKIVSIIFAIIFTLLLAVLAFALFYEYSADEIAQEALKATNVEVFEDEKIIAVHAQTPSDTAIMFYPGGQVEYSSYLPLMQALQEQLDLTCVIVEMPFNIAFFDTNAGDKILEKFPDIKNWYIIGHSVGGTAASMFAEENAEIVDLLILLGSYTYSDYPIENTLTIYGSLNTSVEHSLTYAENVYVIKGGNHAQFGNYGKQYIIDVDADISAEEQQGATVDIISKYLANHADVSSSE